MHDDGRRTHQYRHPSAHLLWSDLSNPFVWLVMCSTLTFGAIGFADDYIKVIHRRNLGLTTMQKMSLQMISGVVVALVLLAMQGEGIYSRISWCPFSSAFAPICRYTHWARFLIWVQSPFYHSLSSSPWSSSSPAMQSTITDGLDGLAIGCTIIAAAALTVLTYYTRFESFANCLC
jgi:phospho-N-acetylmuramoyl-pentapeptide-transferase